MPTPTYTLIASTTATGSETTISFSSIPQTYTDLVFRISARATATGTSFTSFSIFPNGVTNNRSVTRLNGNGATASSNNAVDSISLQQGLTAASATTNAFSSLEIYFPNYTTSTTKPLYLGGFSETNATTAYINIGAGLYSGSGAITSIDLSRGGGDFASGSTFYLYGIKNS